MPALSSAQVVTARKNVSTILRALAAVGQINVAEAFETSETTVSRWKGEKIEEMGQLLAVLGLKSVPQDYKCYDPKSIDALLTLAKERLAQIEHPDHLIWDE